MRTIAFFATLIVCCAMITGASVCFAQTPDKAAGSISPMEAFSVETEPRESGKMIAKVGHFVIADAAEKVFPIKTDPFGNLNIGSLEKGEYLLAVDAGKLAKAPVMKAKEISRDRWDVREPADDPQKKSDDQTLSSESLPAGATFDAETGAYAVFIESKNQIRFKCREGVYAIVLPAVEGVRYEAAGAAALDYGLPLVKILVEIDTKMPHFFFQTVNNFGVNNDGRISRQDNNVVETFMLGK